MDYPAATPVPRILPEWTIFGIITLLAVVIQPATSQINAPPVMHVDQNWRILESEPVGSVITRVTVLDPDYDYLEFGLEPRFPEDAADPDGGSSNKLPFRIDPNTGIVYLNESLEGRAGENFFMYVTVSAGKNQAKTKNEVYVNIYSKNDRNVYSPRRPTQNISQLFPPFHLLPGVQNGRRPPPGGVTINQGSINSNIYPPYNLPPPIPRELPTSPPKMASTNGGANEAAGSRTRLTPVTRGSNSTSQGAPDTGWAKPGPPGAEDAGQVEKSPEAYSVKAIIPVIITICGIFLAAGLIALFVYRKHLCAIGKSLKKKSKEEMAKKSNQSNLSSNITDDSRNSMVLQHWNGPQAFCNRYVPWERDGQQHHSPAGAQLSTSSSTGNVQAKADRWEFPRHRLKFFNILGEGAFGQVWRCEATDVDGQEGVTTVAVKTLKENATEVERNDLYTELQVMKSLEPHVNVVHLLGCCTDKDPIFVIIEYVNRGKLQTYLRSSRAERHYGNTHGKSNVLTSSDLTSFMYQVARGMDFLTSRGIIHRDLAARNILITDDHTCKVADFGFARDVITSKVYERKSEGKLPIRWMAIESLYDNLFSVKSDIWSFGILMWEIVTLGSTPYPGISAADVMKKVRDGYRLEKPEHCRRELYNIMYYCWAKDPNERPSFSELVQLLDKLLHTEMDYIELERFPDHNYYNMLSLSGEKL